jgi:hypothetical protein
MRRAGGNAKPDEAITAGTAGPPTIETPEEETLARTAARRARLFLPELEAQIGRISMVAEGSRGTRARHLETS